MKKILTILVSLISFSMVNANEISSKVSEYVSGFIPGEGDTEVSIDLRENTCPDFSILAVRELEKSLSGNIFTQFSIFSTEQNSDDRIVGNLGFGKRNLSEDNLMLTCLLYTSDAADE